MDSSTRAPGYDLFKLIVAILLLILALVLMWVSPPQAPPPTSIPLPPTGTMPATPTVVPLSPTSPPLTATASPLPSPTVTDIPNPTATPLPIPTETPAVEVTTTPLAGAPATTTCETVLSRSRLRAGANATILRRLNFRSSPGIRDNWLLTNIPGTQVEVVGGPECVPYWNGAYLWWQVQLPDGRVGWSAEGSLHGSFYFMEPSP